MEAVNRVNTDTARIDLGCGILGGATARLKPGVYSFNTGVWTWTLEHPHRHPSPAWKIMPQAATRLKPRLL
jgi:hypothetical protein